MLTGAFKMIHSGMSSPQYLYRIERAKTGIGPYQTLIKTPYRAWFSSYLNDLFDLNLYDHHKCPGPLDDGINYGSIHDLRFGFKNLNLCAKWFSKKPEVIKVFRDYQFRLVRYTVDGDRMDGQKQSCAHADHLKDRVTIPWKELMNA